MYKSSEVKSSIVVVVKIADALNISFVYLAGASEKQLNKEMVKRIEDVDKMKPDFKKMRYTFLYVFITKTKLQTVL